MDEKRIEPKCLHMNIQEYGKIVRQYSDTDKSRFDEIALSIVSEHLKKYSRQKEDEVKNITINIYTY